MGAVDAFGRRSAGLIVVIGYTHLVEVNSASTTLPRATSE
jgi:hypothetical protein